MVDFPSNMLDVSPGYLDERSSRMDLMISAAILAATDTLGIAL